MSASAIRARFAGRGSRAAIGSVATGAGLQLITVATGVIAARLLGVDDRGRLALLWVVTLLAGQLGTLGLHAAVAYAISAGEAPAHVLSRLRPVVLWMLAGAPVVQVLVLLAVVGDWDRDMRVAAASTLVVSPVLVVWLIALGVAQGTQRYRALQRNRILQPLIYVVGLVLTVATGTGDLPVVTAAWSATMVFAGAFAWRDCTGGWRLRRVDAAGETSASLPTTRSMVSFGLRGMLGTFGASEHFMLDQLLVGAFLPARQLGLYAVAAAFANLPRFVGQSIGFVAYPQVAAAARDDRPRVLMRYLTYSVAVLTPIGVALVAGAGIALPFFFGDDFKDASGVASLLILASLTQALRRVLTEASRGLGSGGPGAVSELVFTVGLVAAAIPLMAVDGAQGAALASLIAGLAAMATLATLVAVQTRHHQPSGLPAALS